MERQAGDLALKLVGDASERCTQRSSATLTDKKFVLTQFQVSGANTEAWFYLVAARSVSGCMKNRTARM